MIEPTLLLCAALLAPVVEPPSDETLERVLTRAVDRLQAGIEATTEFFVERSSWETAWQVPSEHYVVRTTAGRRQALQLGRSMDSMLGYYQALLDSQQLPAERFPLYVFPTGDDYNAFGTNAAEHSSYYGAWFAQGNDGNPVACAPHPNPTSLRMQLTHGAFHQWRASVFPGSTAPVWVEEGLASYFSLLWGYAWGADELGRLQAQGRLVPLSRLLTEDMSQWGGGDETHARFVELGMLFNYLLFFREDTRRDVDDDGVVQAEPFAEYLRAVVRGQDVSNDPVHRLLTRDRGQLERDFFAFTEWN